MTSVSTNQGPAEVPESMIGVVPSRMAWVRTWDDRSEIVELYFDANRLDGALVLCVGRAPDEQVATFYWTGSRLGGVVWRGTATGRPQTWRDTQYERVRGYLAA